MQAIVGETMTIRKIAFAAVIGALYATLTMMNPWSYGPVQFRISEVLCILPFFFPYATGGLFVGCILANLLSAYGTLDVVFGSMATLMAALTTMAIGRRARAAAAQTAGDKPGIMAKILACLPPVVFNAVIVGALIAFYTTSFTPAFWAMFATNALWVGLGELVVLYALGLPTLLFLPKSRIFKTLSALYAQNR